MARSTLGSILLATVCILYPVAATIAAELTSATFDPYVREHNTTLVNFASRYSSHCRKLAPAYEQAAGFLKDYNIYLATVDCHDAFDTICVDHGINAYPTLRVYHGDPASYEPYMGGRAVEEIIKHMANVTCPPEICPATMTTTTTSAAPPKTTAVPNPSPDPTARNAVWLKDDGSEAVAKLFVPGLEVATDVFSQSPSSTTEALSVLLNFTISSNGKHLLLNSQPLALQIPDPSRPSRLLAVRVPAEQDFRDIFNLQLGDVEHVTIIGGHLIARLDYSLYARNRDDPGIRYSNYHPDIYLDIIGAEEPGARHVTTLLDSLEQKSIKILLYDRNNPYSASDDPERHYAIEKITFVSRPANYRAPRPNDRACSLRSWRCADLGDPPWYQYVWWQNFDEYGRVGCLRRALLMRRSELHSVLPVPLWVVAVAVVLMIGWRARSKWRSRRDDGAGEKEVFGKS